MIAYTGIETVSNLAEEARDPVKNIPRSIRFVAVAVFAIYFTLPWIALSALPVTKTPTATTRRCSGSARRSGFSNDPVLGLVENLGVHGAALSALKIYVGVLAATILFIATNAGVIGASRITYAMASYRQLPEVFRRLHPKFKTPYISLLVFAGVIPIIVILPGKTAFLGTMYSFGAMLSFTVAHASIVALRVKNRDEELLFRARPNLRFRGVDWPLFAIFGGLGDGAVVARRGRPGGADALGRARLARGRLSSCTRSTGAGSCTRRCSETVRAPVVIGPAVALEYRNVLVPVVWRRESEEAVDLACRLASRAARVDRRPDRARGAAGAAARRRAPGSGRAQGARAARRGARDRRRLRRGRRRPARARPAGGPRDRRGGRAAQQRDRRHGRAAARRAPPPRPDLRRHRRLRAQERALPRDGGGGAGERHERHATAG